MWAFNLYMFCFTSCFICIIYYFASGMGVKICNMSVCLSVCWHNSKTTLPNFTKSKFCVHVAYGHGSALLWTLRFGIYFRFCVWCHVSHNGHMVYAFLSNIESNNFCWTIMTGSTHCELCTRDEVWYLQLPGRGIARARMADVGHHVGVRGKGILSRVWESQMKKGHGSISESVLSVNWKGIQPVWRTRECFVLVLNFIK